MAKRALRRAHRSRVIRRRVDYFRWVEGRSPGEVPSYPVVAGSLATSGWMGDLSYWHGFAAKRRWSWDRVVPADDWEAVVPPRAKWRPG